MSDEWYFRRDELRQGMVFRCHDGSIIKLEHRVPGDGTDWRVSVIYGNRWCYEETRIHPGDLMEQVADPTANLEATT